MAAGVRAGDLCQPSVHQFRDQAAPHTDNTSILVLVLVSSVVDLAETKTGFPVQNSCVHCPCVLPMIVTQLTCHGHV